MDNSQDFSDNLEYLKNEIKRLKFVNKEINSKLDEKTEELSDNKLHFKGLRAYIKDLEKQKQDLINKNDDNNVNMQGMQEQIQNKKLETQTLTEEKLQLNYIIEKQKQRYIQLEQKCDQIDEQLKNTNNLVHATNQDRGLAKTNYNESENLANQLHQLQALKDSEVKGLEEQIKELIVENTKLKYQLEVERINCAKQIDLVQQEVKTLRAHNTNLTKTLQENDGNDRVTSQQQQLKLNDEAITKLQTDNADLKSKMNNLKIEMEKSRQEFMTEKQKEIEKLNSELKVSNVIITQHETKITELSEKQSSYSIELVDNALTYNDKLQEKVNELKAENDQFKVAKEMQDLKITELSSKLTLYEKSGKAAVNQNEIARLNKEINSLKQKLESRSTKNEQNEKVASSLSAMNLELERERQANNTQHQLIAELNEKNKNLTDKFVQNDINIETIVILKEELNKMNYENAYLKSHHEIAVGDNAEEIDLVQQEVKTLRAHNTNLTKTLQEKDILINEQIRVIDSFRIHYEHKKNQSSNSPNVNIPTRTDQLRTPQTTPKIPASVPMDNKLQGQNTDTTLTTANTSAANKGATWNPGYTDIKQVHLCELYENPTAKAPTKTLCGDWGYQHIIRLSKHPDFTKHQDKQVFVKGKNGKLELGVLKAFVKRKEKDLIKIVGIQLYNANGNSNGDYKASKDSSRYFECKPNHGIYAYIEDVFFVVY